MITFLKNKNANLVYPEEKHFMGSDYGRTHISHQISKFGSPASELQWECPYCKGVGIDPYNMTGIKNCPACHGHIFWESDVKYLDLERCEQCDGTGKTNLHGQWTVCPQCRGAGRV
jgi:hypothetical protein